MPENLFFPAFLLAIFKTGYHLPIAHYLPLVAGFLADLPVVLLCSVRQ